MVGLVKLIRGAATSRTVYGIAGLLGVNLADPSGLDVRLWINGQIFDLGNILSPILSILLATLAVYGRVKASGPLLIPSDTPAIDPFVEPRGFPRG